jgi:type IV pilus assembly protein PilA
VDRYPGAKDLPGGILAAAEPPPRPVSDERGFTLIELLIVVIIIGVLAAIAIPAYVGQQDKARDTAAQAELRAAATSQQLHYAQTGEYATDTDALRAHGFRQGGQEVRVAAGGDGSSYCMEATGGGENEFHITQATGRPMPDGCG